MDHLMHENRTFLPKKAFRQRAPDYDALYKESLENPEEFWLKMSEEIDWEKKPTQACRYNWDTENQIIEHTWFADGTLNLSYNCVDRHVDKNKTAIIWEGDEKGQTVRLSYADLLKQVCRMANVLKKWGVQKGDRVCIYLPMIPEVVIAMLACARIGAVHSVVFGGFSYDALAHRIDDAGCKLLITANAAYRSGKKIALKEISDKALAQVSSIEKVLVLNRQGFECPMTSGRDLDLQDEMQSAADYCSPEPLGAEDPLFILYTSGSTGKPKGVVHTQGGYLLQTMLTHRYLFDLQNDDIYFCTADCGWVTGHSYLVYGPLGNGATTVMFEGTPTYPDPGRFWEIIENYKVSLFYTAPTAIRALIRLGETYPLKYDLSSLRVLGTVGEPINPEAWMWYYEVIGKGNCPIVDTWWQTETGAILLSPLPGCHALKPGSAGRPFFGVEPVIFTEEGKPCTKDEGGSLCIKRPWPSMMRTMWGDHERFIETYFAKFPNFYFTGDGCRKDPDGDYWLLGRIDDVVNVSGHRIGTAEIEGALVSHEAVAEAAVVPFPHEIKGQGLLAFVTLVASAKESLQLKSELLDHVRQEIGPIAVPDKIQFAAGLPKTRSGKIMRRILRKIGEKDLENLGDTTTLSDPNVLKELLDE